MGICYTVFLGTLRTVFLIPVYIRVVFVYYLNIRLYSLIDNYVYLHYILML